MYPYVDRFLDCSCLPMVLTAYNVETVVHYVVSCLLDVCMDGRGLLEMFLASFPQGPGCLSYVFLNTTKLLYW